MTELVITALFLVAFCWAEVCQDAVDLCFLPGQAIATGAGLLFVLIGGLALVGLVPT